MLLINRFPRPARSSAVGYILISLLTGILIVALSWYGYNLAHRVIELENQWEQYSQDISRAYEAIVKVRSHLGYGGFIHNFKNFVLRKDPGLLAPMTQSLAEINQGLSDYSQVIFGSEEQRELKFLRATIDEYTNRLLLAKELVAAGLSSEEIDKQVRVDDRAALAALQHLVEHVEHMRKSQIYQTSSSFEAALAFLARGAFLIPFVILVGALAMVVLRTVVRANARLTAVGEHLNDVFNAAPDPMLIVSSQGVISTVNQKALQLFGYEHDELIGHPIELLVPEAQRERHRGMRERLTSQPDNRLPSRDREFVAQHKNGEIIPVEIGLSYTQRDGERQIITTVHDVTERKSVESTLRAQQDVLNKAQEVAKFGSWEWDIKNNISSWSDETYRIYGFDADSYTPSYQSELDRTHPDDHALVADVTAAAMAGRAYEIEHRIIRADGEERIVNRRGELYRDADGNAIQMVGSIQDITERKRTEVALRLADSVFEHTSEGIMVTDADNRILRVNEAFTRISGYTEGDALGKKPQELLSSERHPSEFYDQLWTSLNETGFWQGEIWDRRKNNEIYPSRHYISVVRDESGRVTQHITIFTDITEEKRAEDRIQRLAHYDQLTGLPNRILFEDRLQQAFARAKRADTKVGLMFIDLDRFKVVNDTLGHHAGDALLKEMGTRILSCVREQDTVARLGGDEFTIILEDLQQADSAATVAQKILILLQQPISLQGNEVTSGGSIGISIYPEHGSDEKSIVKNADMAMYQAKKLGRNRCQFYTEDLAVNADERFTLENKLRSAVTNNELELYYQPQINMNTGKLVGAEALVRWNDPTRGIVSPGEFIPMAEETGLIEEIGLWVMRQACRQAKAWQDRGYAPFRMSINVSGYQLTHGSIADSVNEVLDETGLDAQYLELEITESHIIANPERTAMALELLRSRGVSLAIDDFGTGYSSLGYLKRLPIDRLKIDRSFVVDIPHDKDDEAIVSAVISMARHLGLEVIAEGVEHPYHITFLVGHGCAEMQGYYFSCPLQQGEFEEKYLAPSFAAACVDYRLAAVES